MITRQGGSSGGGGTGYLGSSVDPKSVWKAIAHPIRRKMLVLICQKGEVGFSELLREFEDEVSKSDVSQHVRELVIAGLCNVPRREGQFKYYTPNYNGVREIVDFAKLLWK